MTPGALIGGRFLLERQTGAGGMGTVFRAEDRRDGGSVALKILHGRDDVDVERFVREAAILAELSHPNIVRYAGHGVTEEGAHYLAMEWLEGEDLATRLARSPLSDAETLAVVAQAAAAVGFAHARGAVHRDLKPGNLFLRQRDVGRLAVVDFGIAGLAGDPHKLTQTGVLLGTPGYVAPEQVQGEPIQDPRSDIFSLGCVLFECLTGHAAFEGPSPMAVLAKLLLQDPPRLRQVRPGIAAPLDALVARMLAKDPDDRPQTLAEVEEEIEVIGATCALRAAPSLSPPITLVSAEGPDAGPASTGGAPSSRRPALGREEQRIVSVVLVGRPALDDDEDEEPALPAGLAAELAEAAAPHGGQLSALAGGALIITGWGPGTAVDRAELAALAARAVRARCPELPIALVTGRGQRLGRAVEGEVLHRGLLALAATLPRALSVDATSAALLATRAEPERADAASWALGALGALRAGHAGAALRAVPCVGRNRELAMLEGIFAGCASEPVASAVLLVGPASTGKSHLRRELCSRLRLGGQPPLVLLGRAAPFAGRAPFGAVADLVRHAAGIRGGETLDDRRALLTARLSQCLTGPILTRVASLLGELAGAPFPDADAVLLAARESPVVMGDAVQAAWEEWLIAECAARPVVLVLEDLHWADAATARLVEATLKSLRDLPLLILALSRRADVLAGSSRLDLPVIKLGPLPARAGEKLARDLLGAPDEARAHLPPILEHLVTLSGGNPFYLVELVRAAAAGRGDVVPDAVLGVAESRLDEEGPDARRILRAASAFGDRFTAAGVAALLRCAVEDARRALEALSARDLVAPVGPITARSHAEGELAFSQPLVGRAAFAMLTEADRALADHLVTAFADRAAHADSGRE